MSAPAHPGDCQRGGCPTDRGRPHPRLEQTVPVSWVHPSPWVRGVGASAVSYNSPSGSAGFGLPDCRVDNRPEVDDPPKQDEPQSSSQYELNDGSQEPTLK